MKNISWKKLTLAILIILYLSFKVWIDRPNQTGDIKSPEEVKEVKIIICEEN